MSTSTSASRHQQQGAALAIALLMLVIITLLGVAAVRATQVELKLTRNSESRMTASQSAESLVEFVATITNLPVNGDSTFKACMRGSALATRTDLDCGSDTAIIVTDALAPLQEHGYARVQRVLPLFVEVNVLRDEGVSARNYDFARFNITSGYDRSAEGMSAAEVTEGKLRLHTKLSGVNYE